MSEVMISRRGGSSSSGSGTVLHTEYILFNQNWTVPSGVKNNEFSVRIFGAGGINSGGSGWMNNDVFTNLVEDSIIPITIGRYSGVIRNESNLSNVYTNYIGGTTSFGSYLSANGGRFTNGGSGGSSGGTNGWGGIGYQFGGGGDSYSGISYGGNGGVWGGGGGGGMGGHGGIYGGGGGANMLDGGNGGTYGGGGGSSITRSTYTNYCNASGFGRGGEYGGNGGYCNYYSSAYFINYLQLSTYIVNAQNGTNTSTWTNVTKDDVSGEYFRGWGIRGRDSVDGDRVNFGGGGGFGGNGGSNGGGGGGYGSNGGWYGGGGGGYGINARGGNSIFNSSSGTAYGAGGGGGYMGAGGSVTNWYYQGGGGGGGYYSNGNSPTSGGSWTSGGGGGGGYLSYGCGGTYGGGSYTDGRGTSGYLSVSYYLDI